MLPKCIIPRINAPCALHLHFVVAEIRRYVIGSISLCILIVHVSTNTGVRDQNMFAVLILMFSIERAATQVNIRAIIGVVPCQVCEVLGGAMVK